MKSEQELLKTLAEAEDNMKNKSIAQIIDSFDNLRASLAKRKIDRYF